MSSRSVVITLLTIAACFSRVLLVQSTSTSDYSPSEDVKNGHNLIHWNPAPQDSREVNYLLSIIFPAAVITIIGLLSVIVFQLTLIGRWCMRSFKCCGVSKTLASYRGNLMVFGCLLIACGVAAHMLFIGNSGVNDGFTDAADGLGTLGGEFNDLKSDSVDLSTLGTDIRNDAAICSSGCIQYDCCSSGNCASGSSANDQALSGMFTVFQNQGSILKTVGDGLVDLVKDVPGALDAAETVMRGQAIETKNLVIFIVYAILMVVLVGYAAAAYFKNKIGTQVMIFISEIIVVVLTLSCGVCMFVVTLLGDFCMDPSGNIIDLVTETTNSTQFKELLDYYLNCIGSSPIGTDLQEGIDSLDVVLDSIDNNSTFVSSAGAACTAGVDSIKDDSLSSKDTLVDLLDFFDCSTVNNAWSKIVNEGLCTSGYSGFYALWISLYLVSLCLFFIMCISAILFKQYEYRAEGLDDEEDGEITYDANDQAFLDNPGVQMVQNPDGTIEQLDPQQGEKFDNVYYGRAV